MNSDSRLLLPGVCTLRSEVHSCAIRGDGTAWCNKCRQPWEGCCVPETRRQRHEVDTAGPHPHGAQVTGNGGVLVTCRESSDADLGVHRGTGSWGVSKDKWKPLQAEKPGEGAFCAQLTSHATQRTPHSGNAGPLRSRMSFSGRQESY